MIIHMHKVVYYDYCIQNKGEIGIEYFYYDTDMDLTSLITFVHIF